MTRHLFAAAAAAFGLASTFAVAETSGQAVQRLDPALDALVSPDAKVELVKGGFGFTEGPVWMQKGKEGYLLFTDIPGNVVWKLTADGKASFSTMSATAAPRCGAGAASRTTASTR
jgi:gluconolactonase